MSSEALTLDGVSKHFGGVVAVDSVSFVVRQGEVCGLVGPNGAGKTTFINVITGFARPTGGRVEFFGQDITGWNASRLSRLGLVRTFQHAHTFTAMTVLDALVTAGYVDEGSQRALGIRGLWRSGARHESRRHAEEVLEKLGLAAWAGFTTDSLPYGIKKRLGVGLALMRRPRLLLLDEPAAGLNSDETEELTGFIRTVNAEGVTMIIVEHNMAMITTLSDTMVVLDHGAMLASGTPDEVMTDSRVVGAYLGKR